MGAHAESDRASFAFFFLSSNQIRDCDLLLLLLNLSRNPQLGRCEICLLAPHPANAFARNSCSARRTQRIAVCVLTPNSAATS